MKYTASLAALGFAAMASSAHHRVNVGETGLVYTPNTTYAAVGDTVVFHYYPKNHSVVQGSYSSPCMSTQGIYSGFIPSAANASNTTFHVTINDTNPIWFYCSQPGLGGHCTLGMVGVINPPNSSNQTLASYAMAAKSVANTSYTHPAMVQGGIRVTSNGTSNSTGNASRTSSAASTATGVAGYGSASASATGSTTMSGSASGTSSAAVASITKTAGAVMEVARWGVGAVVAGGAVLLL